MQSATSDPRGVNNRLKASPGKRMRRLRDTLRLSLVVVESLKLNWTRTASNPRPHQETAGTEELLAWRRSGDDSQTNLAMILLQNGKRQENLRILKGQVIDTTWSLTNKQLQYGV